MDKLPIAELITTALDYRDNAYAPYSHFKVGAALLAGSGKIYGGCNIENAAYSPTNCAERTAVYKAISEGEREFEAIAIVGGHEGGMLVTTPPCGVCRQVLSEFCPAEMIVILARGTDDYSVYTLGELLPMSFGKESARSE